jgi:hypothetical protein
LVRVASATAPPDENARPRRARSTAAVMLGNMKISKFAA